MFTIKNYVVADSLEQAYELLNKGRNNSILGGLLWLKMGEKNINTAIDLSNLGLDKIEETNEEFKIGAMVSLRDVEINEALNREFNNIFKKSVESIIGVQFRNCATMGGSVYSRFGFSDILTALLALDTYVELHKEGIVSLREFVEMPYNKDILIRIIIKKNKCKSAYMHHRLAVTDLPVLAVAVSNVNDNWKISVGARPSKASLSIKAQDILNARLSEESIDSACEAVVNELTFGSNLRGSKEYREVLAKTLVKRAIKEIMGEN